MPTEDLVIKRIINAPVKATWNAWTQPERLMQWWGPQYYSSPSCTVDLRVGGKFVFAMQAPQEMGGQLSYSSGTYSNIVPQELLEFSFFISDAEGNPIDPAAIGLPEDFPNEIPYSISFKKLGEMTELTITERGWPMIQMRVFSYAGMQQSIDKLVETF